MNKSLHAALIKKYFHLQRQHTFPQQQYHCQENVVNTVHLTLVKTNEN